MTRWPAFRTIPEGQVAIQRSDTVLAMAVPFLAFALLGWATAAFDLFDLGGVVGIAVFLSPMSLPLFLAIFTQAMRKGIAGWANALMFGGAVSALPLIAIAAFDPSATLRSALPDIAMFASVGIGFTGLIWLTLYLRRPEAFVRPVAVSASHPR